ncbi:aldose epimerase family protein [Phaeobacter sp. C3_T13_0]|uniref:aldose epimerase family protein n=1 Tax=Phaeobacter cretensis TaxID=3342641 RepID=UPI0039BCE083
MQHPHLPENAAEQLQWIDLENDKLRLRVLNLGGVTARLDLRRDNVWQPMVLGYHDMTAYLGDPFYLGAIVGRVANRIGRATFDLGGKGIALCANEGGNQLHGGPAGLGRVFWDMRQIGGDMIELRYTSADGENGYPGCAEILLRITLSGSNVTYDMSVDVDEVTPINLAQHNYYTLGVDGDIWQHRLQSAADAYLPVRADGVPTGEIVPVSGTRFDYGQDLTFAALDPRQLGSDTHIVFPEGNSRDAADGVPKVACLMAPNGVVMQMYSDQPGAQVYTAAHLNSLQTAWGEQPLTPFSAVCVEPQGFPDAVNQSGFPSVLVQPDQPYKQQLILSFSQKETASE